MAEFGYNLQDSSLNEFASSANYYSLAESRAFDFNAGDTVTSLNCYANNNQAGSATISFYLYKADVNGTPTDRVSGPHTLFIAGIENPYSVRTVGSLSISIPTTGKYTIVVNNDQGFRIARGASVETTSLATSAADPWVESGTQTWDLAIWGEYTPAPSNTITVDVPTHANLEWGATHELAVTDDTGTVTLAGVTLSAPAGWETVAFTTAPNPATTESFYEYAQTDTGLGGAGYTMLAGDILAWETQTGLTIDGQTIPQVDPPATVSGSYKIFKDATKTWTSVSTFTITDLGFPPFAVNSAPTTYREGEVFNITVSNPATVPTINNTIIEFI